MQTTTSRITTQNTTANLDGEVILFQYDGQTIGSIGSHGRIKAGAVLAALTDRADDLAAATGPTEHHRSHALRIIFIDTVDSLRAPRCYCGTPLSTRRHCAACR